MSYKEIMRKQRKARQRRDRMARKSTIRQDMADNAHKPDLVIADEGQHDTPQPDVIVCDEANHEKAKAGRKVLQSWPDFAAEVFPKLQAEHPELREVTLQEFIAECPYKIEFVG